MQSHRPSPLLQPAVRPSGIPDPYLAYLDGLGTAESRRTIKGALDAIVGLVLEEDVGPVAYELVDPKPTGENVPWWLLRAQDTRHIRDLLVSSRPAPPGVTPRVLSVGTVNKRLSALRGVLETCWRAGLMAGDDYLWAIDELKSR